MLRNMRFNEYEFTGNIIWLVDKHKVKTTVNMFIVIIGPKYVSK